MLAFSMALLASSWTLPSAFAGTLAVAVSSGFAMASSVVWDFAAASVVLLGFSEAPLASIALQASGRMRYQR